MSGRLVQCWLPNRTPAKVKLECGGIRRRWGMVAAGRQAGGRSKLPEPPSGALARVEGFNESNKDSRGRPGEATVP